VGPPGQPTAAKRVALFQAKEGNMKRIDWDAAIRSLVLVRLGQELGYESQLARMVHDSITLVLTMIGIFS
jgi:hypothetical protein